MLEVEGFKKDAGRDSKPRGVSSECGRDDQHWEEETLGGGGEEEEVLSKRRTKRRRERER